MQEKARNIDNLLAKMSVAFTCIDEEMPSRIIIPFMSYT